MKTGLVLAAALALSTAAALAAEPVEVIRIAKDSGGLSVRALVRVANPTAAAADILISCVGYRGEQPVHEEGAVVQNVPAGGSAIKNIPLFTSLPIERAECRVVRY